MQENEKKTEETKKIWDNPIIGTILTFAVGYGLIQVGKLICTPVRTVLVRSNNAAVAFSAEYLIFTGIWILTMLLLIFTQSPMLRAMGPEAKGNKPVISIALGVFCGLGFNVFLALIAVACGDISLSFNEFNAVSFLILFVAVFIQAGAEELVCRVFVYQNLRKLFRTLPIIAIVGSSLFFALCHLGNKGISFLSIFNIGLAGGLYALFVYYLDSFWGCVVAHALWNISQSIILGLLNSGVKSGYSVFVLDYVTETDTFAYSAKFGLEGAVTMTVLYVIAMGLIVFIGKKKKLTSLDVWDIEPEKEKTDEDLLKALD